MNKQLVQSVIAGQWSDNQYYLDITTHVDSIVRTLRYKGFVGFSMSLHVLTISDAFLFFPLKC